MLGNHLVPVHSVNDDRPWVEESWWATLLQVQGSLLCAIHWSTDLLGAQQVETVIKTPSEPSPHND